MNLRSSLVSVAKFFRHLTPTTHDFEQASSIDEKYEALRQWRNQLARDRGIKPYVVFSNRNLQEIAAKNPRTREELLAVEGVGKKRLELYSGQVLGVLHGFARPA